MRNFTLLIEGCEPIRCTTPAGATINNDCAYASKIANGKPWRIEYTDQQEGGEG